VTKGDLEENPQGDEKANERGNEDGDAAFAARDYRPDRRRTPTNAAVQPTAGVRSPPAARLPGGEFVLRSVGAKCRQIGCPAGTSWTRSSSPDDRRSTKTEGQRFEVLVRSLGEGHPGMGRATQQQVRTS
jgi:hypothetical protein